MNNYWKCGPATMKGVADNKLMLFTQGGGSNPSYFHISGNVLDRRNDITKDNKTGVSTDTYGHLVDNVLVPKKFYNPNDAADGNYINAEGYTALEKYLCSLMGEEIKGEFNTASVMRVERAVKFSVAIDGNVLTVNGEKPLKEVYIFDTTGRCRVVKTINSETASFSTDGLGAGTFIVWATDSEGYRNAVKVNLQAK